MIILLSKHRKQNYIVGIFDDEQKAHQHFNKLDEGFEMRSVDLNFPFLIIETFKGNKNEFSFYNNYTSNTNYISYKIDKEYIPKEFGSDEMGSLPHHHVEY